jgi:hypothetical protein
MRDIRNETDEADQKLRDAGYELKVIWEHDYDQMLKTDEEFTDCCINTKIADPLNPRKAFYGGRTNAAKLYHKISGAEEIHYKDVCR